MLAGDVLGEVERKAVRVVELERRFAVEASAALAGRLQRRVQDGHAVLERFEKAFLFLPQGGGHARRGLGELGVGSAHLGDEIRHQTVEEGLAHAQLVAMAHGPANDAPQHIAAAFVAGNDAVGHQERAGADMVGEHAQRGIVCVGHPGFARRRSDQGPE